MLPGETVHYTLNKQLLNTKEDKKSYLETVSTTEGKIILCIFYFILKHPKDMKVGGLKPFFAL